MLYADVFDGFHTGRKISNFMNRSGMPFRQRRLQRIQLRVNQMPPDVGPYHAPSTVQAWNIEREYMCRTIPTSRRQREIVATQSTSNQTRCVVITLPIKTQSRSRRTPNSRLDFVCEDIHETNYRYI